MSFHGKTAAFALATIVATGTAYAQSRNVSPAPTAASPATNKAAAVVDSFHRSLQQGDLVAAAAFLSPDVIIFESGSVERNRAEYVSHHLPADAAFAKVTTRKVTAQSANLVGNFAWIATESRTRGTFKGKAIDSGSTETMVLRAEGGTWKIVHIHWSSGK